MLNTSYTEGSLNLPPETGITGPASKFQASVILPKRTLELLTLLEGILVGAFERGLQPHEQHQFLHWRDEIVEELYNAALVSHCWSETKSTSAAAPHNCARTLLARARNIQWLDSGGQTNFVLGIEHARDFKVDEPILSVFFPIKGGEHNLLRSLIGLTAQLRKLPPSFQYELNLCLNNSRDATFERASDYLRMFPDVPTNIYVLDRQSLRGSGKIFALNFLHDRRKHLFEGTMSGPKPARFIHIADDDIEYGRDCAGLTSNIEWLCEDPSLKVVSATYATSDQGRGFHFLNTLRKDPAILRTIDPLPQVYGGALTLRAADFPKHVPLHSSSFDVYVTLTFLKDLLQADPESYDATTCPVRTNPGFIIDHPESLTFPAFAQRLLRDTAWRRHAISELLAGTVEGDARTFEDNFLKLRRIGFNPITEALDRDREVRPERAIGQSWMRAVRDLLYEFLAEGRLASSHFDDTAALNSGYVPAHDFAGSLINRPSKLRNLAGALQLAGYVTSDECTELKKPELSAKEYFKSLEIIVRRSLPELHENNFHSNPTLVVFSHIVQCNDRERRLAFSRLHVQQLLSDVGITVGDDLAIELLTRSSGVHRVAFASDRDQHFCLKYYDPLGSAFLPRHSPQAGIFLSVLVENIFAELLGAERVAQTLSPSLDQALQGCFGAEGQTDYRRVSRRMIIQPDYSLSHCVLDRYRELGLGYLTVVRLNAAILGEIHGATRNLPGIFGRSSAAPSRLLKLLSLVPDQVRCKNGSEYFDWLSGENSTGTNWVTRIYFALAGRNQHSNSIFTDVTESLRAAGTELETIFRSMCQASAAALDQYGSLAHYDLSPQNIFVARDACTDIRSTRIFDFEQLGFVDPGYELGQTLYSLLRRGIVAGEITSFDSVRELFDVAYASYDQAYLENVGRATSAYVSEVDFDGIHARATFFAAFTLLMVGASEAEKMRLNGEQVNLISATCRSFLSRQL